MYRYTYIYTINSGPHEPSVALVSITRALPCTIDGAVGGNTVER